MKIGVPKETTAGERRVALVPETVKRFCSKKFEVTVESGAGSEAGFLDAAYTEAGATVGTLADVEAADIVLRVNQPTSDEIRRLIPGTTHISQLFPLINTDLAKAFAAGGVHSIALDRIPRTTLAQAMDVLSSQATIAGYRAVILAAEALPKIFPLMMTAAGRLDPARVLILGAGVAGLQAIGIARRLGAVVEAYDVRAAVKEQVESLGATFVEIGIDTDAETKGGYAKEVSEDVQARANEVIGQHLETTDVCITTALIPGRPAPKLVTAEMAKRMKAGSVIVDLAAERGGNCELTETGKTVEINGIRILGPVNLPSEAPYHASQMFSRNIEKLVTYMSNKQAELEFDFDKEIVRGCVVTHDGKIVDEQVAEAAVA